MKHRGVRGHRADYHVSPIRSLVTWLLFVGFAGGEESAAPSALLQQRSVSTKGDITDIPAHQFAAWRVEHDYLVDFEFSLPGQYKPYLNSCAIMGLVAEAQCSGHGKCMTFDSATPWSPTMCKCDPEWADPECRTRRLSQATAFYYSLFLGFFGVDQWYLGNRAAAVAKGLTLGGGGLWYLIDLVRAGAGQPYATVVRKTTFYRDDYYTTFRVAADLPHWVFVTSSLMWFYCLGFTVSALSTMVVQRRKRREFLVLSSVQRNFPDLANRLLNPPQVPPVMHHTLYGAVRATRRDAYGMDDVKMEDGRASSEVEA